MDTCKDCGSSLQLDSALSCPHCEQLAKPNLYDAPGVDWDALVQLAAKEGVYDGGKLYLALTAALEQQREKD